MIDPLPIVEFRDGDHSVPFHVAAMLAGIETWKYTYEEAVKLANEQMLRNRLNQMQQKAIDGHFRKFG